MLLQSKTRAINSAFLEEIKQLDRDLWDLVEDVAVGVNTSSKLPRAVLFSVFA